MSLVRKLVSFWVQEKAGLTLAFFCTQNRGRIDLFLVRHSEQGGPPGPLSLAYSLRPNTFEPARELAKVSHTHPRHSTL